MIDSFNIICIYLKQIKVNMKLDHIGTILGEHHTGGEVS